MQKLAVVLVVGVLFLNIIPVKAATGTVYSGNIAIDQSTMANLSVGTQSVSFRWSMVDPGVPILVTVFFHSYNNSGFILDEGLVSLSRSSYPMSIMDPSQTFNVTINGSIPAADGKLVFNISTLVAPPQITTSHFSGVTGPSAVGLPGSNQRRAVVEAKASVLDVLLGSKWVASFSWVSVTEQVGNQTVTVPQVQVYDTTGAQVDARFVQQTNVRLLPVGGSGGFWLTAIQILSDGVSWLLESSFDITTRPNQGYQLKTLPFLSQSQTLRADLGDHIPLASVSWLLPNGADQFTLLIAGFRAFDRADQAGMATLIDLSYASQGLLLSKDPNSNIYMVQFRPAHIGTVVPVTIQTTAPDGKYQGQTSITTLPDPFLDPSSPFNYLTVTGIGVTGFFLAALFLLVYRRRRPRRISIDELTTLLGRIS
jgi:hypothetical protein